MSYDRQAAADEHTAYMEAVLGRRRERRETGVVSAVPAHLVERRWVVGRAVGCDVRIESDPFVVDQHAILSLLTDGSAMVEALPEGAAHTAISRQGRPALPIRRPTPVEPGDTVYVGSTALPWRK